MHIFVSSRPLSRKVMCECPVAPAEAMALEPGETR